MVDESMNRKQVTGGLDVTVFMTRVTTYLTPMSKYSYITMRSKVHFLLHKRKTSVTIHSFYVEMCQSRVSAHLPGRS
jgi:hypothetical protein